MPSIPAIIWDFNPTNLNTFILTTKKFLWIFYCISTSTENSEVFEKNLESHSLSISENYSHQKTLLHECLPCPVSEDLSGVNVLTGPKHCRSLQEMTFIVVFHYSDIDRARKLPS